MYLTATDVGYTSIYQHYISENKPRRFNYQGYFWTVEGQEPDLSFRRGDVLPIFQFTTHTDRPAMKNVAPVDAFPNG